MLLNSWAADWSWRQENPRETNKNTFFFVVCLCVCVCIVCVYVCARVCMHAQPVPTCATWCWWDTRSCRTASACWTTAAPWWELPNWLPDTYVELVQNRSSPVQSGPAFVLTALPHDRPCWRRRWPECWCPFPSSSSRRSPWPSWRGQTLGLAWQGCLAPPTSHCLTPPTSHWWWPEQGRCGENVSSWFHIVVLEEQHACFSSLSHFGNAVLSSTL